MTIITTPYHPYHHYDHFISVLRSAYNSKQGMDPRQFMAYLRQTIEQKRASEVARLILNYPRCAELVLVLDAEDKNAYFRAIFVPEESLCVKVLEHLRGFGGNIKQKDKNNQTILYFAARLEHEEVVRYLMRFDFPLNDNDFFSQTPLFYASKFNKRTQISESFLKAGCEVNHRDNNGQTCLFYAAGSGNLEICQLLVDYGANVQHLDKNREKASNYARKNGHMRVVQYLHLCKNDARKQKEERRQESSQNTAERRKRKEIVRNEYCLVFTNENGEVKVLTPQELQKFKAASEDHNRLHRLMAEPDEPIDALAPVPDKRFERIAMKILNHFWKLENSYHFYEPVNYQALSLHDYPTIVRYPMDFGTVKRKLLYNAYENQYEFQGDMNLVFDNCILYNGTERDIGKIALQMKMEFNTMFVKDFSL